MRPIILGTAGHIDHGKTALVRRLTGIDTDRLKEEKERGISIDLGFAHLTLPSGARVGIVDVPGHERFVKNMLAGATGIDVVLLVVAADEGVMPQTREHLAIVDLLAIGRGVVALTKADLAPPERVERSRTEVRDLLAGTLLEDSPILPVSAVTGQGVPELLAALDRAAAAAARSGAREAGRPARLPIDRVFSIEGIGTVVTGTLWGGTIRAGDALEILPSKRAVRVRRVEVHDAEVPAAVAGQRSAVALHGVERDDLARGDWLVAAGRFRAADLLDVRLTHLAGADRALATRARVRVHLGASEVLARAVLLEGDALAPGASGLAQLRLEEPLVAVPGDRLVLRSYSPAATVAGAVVIDPAPPRRARLLDADRDRLRVLESGTLPEKAAWLAGVEGFAGIRDEEIALRIGAEPEEVAAAVSDAPGVTRLRDGRLLARAVWEAALKRVEGEVRRYAEAHRLRAGLPKGELKSLLAREMDGPVFDEALGSLVAEGAVTVQGDRILPPGAAPALTEEQRRTVERMELRLASQGFQPPDLPAILADMPREARPQELVRYLIESDRVVRVTSELLYTRSQWEEIENRIRAHFRKSTTLALADFKSILQVSRKYAVPLLEHLDRIGLTRREGDERLPGPKFKN
ncbi:MAG TPA: selenocysteine-specific translation elongation factor [Candidatus Limnocylindrales bacterium]|nr:selenocysteine-specific translation elongation factor [Candidatus Limnocylindrales bacterium]